MGILRFIAYFDGEQLRIEAAITKEELKGARQDARRKARGKTLDISLESIEACYIGQDPSLVIRAASGLDEVGGGSGWRLAMEDLLAIGAEIGRRFDALQPK